MICSVEDEPVTYSRVSTAFLDLKFSPRQQLKKCYHFDMPTLLIRDVPRDLHKQLVQTAKKERRSKEKQALILLERALAVRRIPDNTIEIARKLRAQCKREVSMEEILAATEGPH